MNAEMERLTEEVGELTTVVESAVEMINGVAQIIRDNATNEAKLRSFADELDANSKKLAEAIAANTPEE